jgi:hypothetical protein
LIRPDIDFKGSDSLILPDFNESDPLKLLESVTRRIASVARVVALLAAIDTASAQSGSGSIHGIVNDSTGAPQSGATVRIHGTETYRHTDPRGQFAFDGLRPGSYGLTATAIAARPVRDSVVVRAGDTTRVRFVMRFIHFSVETLPPRFAPGTRPDTAPDEAEAFDRVARMASLPLLRAQPPSGRRRELRFWIGGGIAIPYVLIRIIVDGDPVQGQVIRHLEQTIPDRGANLRWRAFIDSVPSWLRRDFGCRSVATDTIHYPEAQAGYRDRLVAVCSARYPREPDWRGLLRELETHHVWTLPDESELPTIRGIVSVDGGGATVEAWNGVRYHSYTIGDTSHIATPEARDGAEIQRILNAFLTHLHYELHPPSR